MDLLRNTIEAREALEIGLITSLTLAHLTPDVTRLSELLTEMDGQAQGGAIEPVTDQAFHLALYEPLANPLASGILEVLWTVTGQFVVPLTGNRVEAMATADRHHSILMAIRAADPRGARVAMQNHFVGLRQRMGMSARAED